MSSFGSSQNTQSTNTSTGATTGTYTPTQNANVTDFRNSLYPQISSFLANAQKPVYGAAQQAQFTNQLNQNTNANMNQLASQLASRTGSVNSGAYASGLQGMLQSRSAAQSGYAMQVPMLNQQAYQTNVGQALSLGNQIAGPALTSNTTAGTSNQLQNQNSTTTYNPSVMGDISGIAGIAGSAFGLPGVSSLFGGSNPMSGAAGATGYNTNMGNNISGNLGGVGGYGMGNFSDIGYPSNFNSIYQPSQGMV